MRRAFSLMELLVSLAILTILAAIALPALSQAQARARQVTCSSNLYQLGRAALQYAADYDEALPLTSHSGPAHAWGITLRAYGVTPALRICPGDPLASVRLAQGGTSYAWNENLLSELPKSHEAGTSQGVAYIAPPRLDQLNQPTRTLLLIEQSGLSGTDTWGDHIHNRAWQRHPKRLLEMLQSDLALRRHPGGVLATCADGHLQHFSPGQLEEQVRQGHDPLRVTF